MLGEGHLCLPKMEVVVADTVPLPMTLAHDVRGHPPEHNLFSDDPVKGNSGHTLTTLVLPGSSFFENHRLVRVRHGSIILGWEGTST